MLTTLVTCFGITWMPLYVLTMVGEVNPFIYDRTDIYLLWVAFQLIAYSSSALNSIIYFSLNDSFQKSFRRLVGSVAQRKSNKLEEKKNNVTLLRYRRKKNSITDFVSGK